MSHSFPCSGQGHRVIAVTLGIAFSVARFLLKMNLSE
jgi:hypothetical protein